MALPIRVVHFADFHLGVDTYGPVDPDTKINGRVLDFLDSFDSLIDFAVENDADLAIFAGDAFHNHRPDPTYLREFGERIIRLSEQCPTVLVVGNHDMPGILEKASAVDVFSTLRVPNVIVGWDYEVHHVETKRGIIQICTFPYPFKSQWLSTKESRAKNIETIFRKKISTKLAELSKEVDDNYPAIFAGHLSVDRAKYGSERDMLIGLEAQVSLDDLIYPWDYVALGHIHFHQNLTEGIDNTPPVIYPGSLDRVNFGEEDDDKGFVWVEIGDEVKWEFILVDARPFVTIDFDASDIKKPTDKIISIIEKMDLERAVVRVIVRIESERDKFIYTESIYEAIIKAGAYYVYSIRVDRLQSNRTIRLSDNGNITSLTKEDLLKLYFRDVGVDVSSMKKLLVVAKDIIQEVNIQDGR